MNVFWQKFLLIKQKSFCTIGDQKLFVLVVYLFGGEASWTSSEYSQ